MGNVFRSRQKPVQTPSSTVEQNTRAAGNVFRSRQTPVKTPTSTVEQNTRAAGNVFRSRQKPVKTPTSTVEQNTRAAGKSYPPELDELYRVLKEKSKLFDEMYRDLGDMDEYLCLAVPTRAVRSLNSSNTNEQVPDLAPPVLVLDNALVVHGTEVLQSAGTYEVELNWEGESELHNLKRRCRKSPGHDKFIPVHEFDKEHLPALYRHDLIIELVRCLSTLTVRLRVDKISLSRPNPPYPPNPRRDNLGRDCSINGTGHVTSAVVCSEETDAPCACPECLESGNPVRSFAKIFIQTAAHVVYDDLEAANTACYFNYVKDIDGLDTAVRVLGTKGVHVDVKEDRCWMFGYTHDLSLAKKLGFMSDNYQRLRREVSDKYCVNWSDTPEDKLTIIVSHPHGCSKCITVGNMQGRLAAPDDDDWTQYSYTTPTCPGSSGAPIFMLGKHGYIDNHHHSGAVPDTGLNVSTFGLF